MVLLLQKSDWEAAIFHFEALLDKKVRDIYMYVCVRACARVCMHIYRG